MTAVPGNPFGVAVTRDGRYAFVSLLNSVAVMRLGGPSPVLVRTIPVRAGALGEALTNDGRYLLAADGSGAIVINVASAERSAKGAVVGTLTSPSGGGAIEVTVSRDDRYAFVTLEGAERAVAFNLARALSHGFGMADYTGAIPLGVAPVGMAVSPDGHWLYATSEAASIPIRTGLRTGLAGSTGTLTVINLARAETDPARSVVATVPAGCSPVRVITTAGGSEVWVTARASDDLLCFNATVLRAHPARALVAIVRVGAAPVGLAAIGKAGGQSMIVVANSNRFSAPGASSSLSVVDVTSALAQKPAVLGTIRAGGFPREMTLTPGGRVVLVTNFASGQVESVTVPNLP
jgi:DNA-binding beta-propeller fold protein YncE